MDCDLVPQRSESLLYEANDDSITRSQRLDIAVRQVTNPLITSDLLKTATTPQRSPITDKHTDESRIVMGKTSTQRSNKQLEKEN